MNMRIQDVPEIASRGEENNFTRFSDLRIMPSNMLVRREELALLELLILRVI